MWMDEYDGWGFFFFFFSSFLFVIVDGAREGEKEKEKKGEVFWKTKCQEPFCGGNTFMFTPLFMLLPKDFVVVFSHGV